MSYRFHSPIPSECCEQIKARDVEDVTVLYIHACMYLFIGTLTLTSSN